MKQSTGKPPTLAQIRRDEQKQFKQVLSDEKIREILQLNEKLDFSKCTRPILSLLSKHDWLPMRLVADALGFDVSSVHKAVTRLRDKKMIETKVLMYHHKNNALWAKITPEGKQVIRSEDGPNKRVGRT